MDFILNPTLLPRIWWRSRKCELFWSKLNT